jgi:uncharacterized membrane protein SirB2
VVLPTVFITLLLLLPVTLAVASSQFRSRGATSWVHAKLLVCGPYVIILVLFFLLRLSFMLELGAPYLICL